MKRKTYIHKMQNLHLAVYHHPSSAKSFPEGYKIGQALRHVRDNASDIPRKFGSYEAAWNLPPVKWAREYYGVD